MALNSLFNDILSFALIKTNEGMVYYWEQAHNCNDLIKKIFLLYVSVKKLHIITFLKRVIEGVNSDILSAEEFVDMFRYLNIYNEGLSGYSLKKIYDTVSEQAMKELEFFQLLKIPRKTNTQDEIMDALIVHMKKFLESIKTGYEKLISGSAHQRKTSGKPAIPAKRNYYGTYA